MNYLNKLQDKRWQEKRQRILERDKHTCRKCQTSGIELHVHHLFYIECTEPWDYEDYLLITLCKECHEKRHHIHKQIELPPDSIKHISEIIPEAHKRIIHKSEFIL